MKAENTLKYFFLALFLFANGSRAQDAQEKNKVLLKKIKQVHQLSDDQLKKVEQIFQRSGFISQGNPAVTQHPMTQQECQDRAKGKKIIFENQDFLSQCASPYMAPLYDPSKEKASDAKTCMDQFEFPNIPCEYPVVWVRANEAAEICSAMGKRLCDAHEWEGGCEGRLTPPDYPFAEVANLPEADAFRAMRSIHNRKQKEKIWAYGRDGYKKGICAANSTKAQDCNGGDWKRCGSNTYPAGSFTDCVSPLGVYDIHGNAAEHMSLPVRPEQMTASGGLGHTEMKGSWFIFDKYVAHEDWCRWRAPYWHGSKVADSHSHHNYHLGFRCCKSLQK